MSQPFRCPVCNGNGLVPNGFYSKTGETWVSYSTQPETCRSCNGTGVVWGHDPQPTPIGPRPNPFAGQLDGTTTVIWPYVIGTGGVSWSITNDPFTVMY